MILFTFWNLQLSAKLTLFIDKGEYSVVMRNTEIEATKEVA